MSCERKDISIELSPEFKKAFKRFGETLSLFGTGFWKRWWIRCERTRYKVSI